MKTEVGCNKKQQSVAAGVIGWGNVQPGVGRGPPDLEVFKQREF